jgi:hypothetical protein
LLSLHRTLNQRGRPMSPDKRQQNQTLDRSRLLSTFVDKYFLYVRRLWNATLALLLPSLSCRIRPLRCFLSVCNDRSSCADPATTKMGKEIERISGEHLLRLGCNGRRSRAWADAAPLCSAFVHRSIASFSLGIWVSEHGREH